MQLGIVLQFFGDLGVFVGKWIFSSCFVCWCGIGFVVGSGEEGGSSGSFNQ